MVIQCFFLFFLFLSYLLPLSCSGTQPIPTSGPFKTSIVSVKDCSNPSKPFMKNPPLILSLSILNIDGINLIGGNLTVLREVKDIKVKQKCFAWRNSKWRHILSFNNLNCRSTMLYFSLAAVGIKYDKNTCTFKKGFYIIQYMDGNKLQHIWVPTMPYGRMLWRFDAFYKDGMFICKEFDTITEPAG